MQNFFCNLLRNGVALQVAEKIASCNPGEGVLRGKKDSNDRQKSWKTTLKNTKP